MLTYLATVTANTQERESAEMVMDCVLGGQKHKQSSQFLDPQQKQNPNREQQETYRITCTSLECHGRPFRCTPLSQTLWTFRPQGGVHLFDIF